eukprot:GHVN01005363.1.p1 GENE.GHVN01005363.1~~GHVN01005363.1.p1  ORF type:complete len:823 (-),score=223.99 GHVN01005363.1:651-3119(-)
MALKINWWYRVSALFASCVLSSRNLLFNEYLEVFASADETVAQPINIDFSDRIRIDNRLPVLRPEEPPPTSGLRGLVSGNSQQVSEREVGEVGTERNAEEVLNGAPFRDKVAPVSLGVQPESLKVESVVTSGERVAQQDSLPFDQIVETPPAALPQILPAGQVDDPPSLPIVSSDELPRNVDRAPPAEPPGGQILMEDAETYQAPPDSWMRRAEMWVVVRGVIMLKIAAIVSSFLLQLSPMTTVLRIAKHRCTGTVDSLPFFMVLYCAVLWLVYGILRADIVILLPAVTGLFFGLFYVTTYHTNCGQFGPQRRMLEFYFQLLVVTIPALVIGVAICGTARSIGVVGIIAAVCNVVSCASPLATVQTVLKEKCTASMPAPLSISNFINNVLWLAYGCLVTDTVVVLPAGLGVVISSLQLTILILYPANPMCDVLGGTKSGSVITLTHAHHSSQSPHRLSDVIHQKFHSSQPTTPLNITPRAITDQHQSQITSGSVMGGGAGMSDRGAGMSDRGVGGDQGVRGEASRWRGVMHPSALSQSGSTAPSIIPSLRSDGGVGEDSGDELSEVTSSGRGGRMSDVGVGGRRAQIDHPLSYVTKMANSGGGGVGGGVRQERAGDLTGLGGVSGGGDATTPLAEKIRDPRVISTYTQLTKAQIGQHQPHSNQAQQPHSQHPPYSYSHDQPHSYKTAKEERNTALLTGDEVSEVGDENIKAIRQLHDDSNSPVTNDSPHSAAAPHDSPHSAAHRRHIHSQHTNRTKPDNRLSSQSSPRSSKGSEVSGSDKSGLHEDDHKSQLFDSALSLLTRWDSLLHPQATSTGRVERDNE